jgi:hypothetical protein
MEPGCVALSSCREVTITEASISIVPAVVKTLLMGVRNVRHPILLARESLLRAGVTADGSPVDDGVPPLLREEPLIGTKFQPPIPSKRLNVWTNQLRMHTPSVT